MSGYLGSTARMVPVAPSSTQSEEVSERFVYQDSRARRWAWSTARPDGSRLRSWSVALSVLPNAEAGLLGEFLDGQHGPGPFFWVPCAAHSGNVLTPKQSALTGIATGSTDGVSGFAPRAHLGPSSVILAAGVPVLPGKPASVGVEMSGGTMTLTWRNAAGSSVGTSSASASGSAMQRVVWSGVVPATARTVDLGVSGHVAATRPQVVWESSLPPYVTGRGAGAVVLDSGSVEMLARARSGAYWTGSLGIVEVG